MIDIKSVIGGAVVSAAVSIGLIAGMGSSTETQYVPQEFPPAAPALESGDAVKYFCKPGIAEQIDNSPSGYIPSSTDPGRAPVIHICRVPDGTNVVLSGSGKFIDAKDPQGLPMTEAQIKEYLR